MKTKLTLIITFLLCSLSWAQEGTVTGTLMDSDNLPLPGVNVIVEGTTTGTQTDFDGYYRIKCAVGDVLVFTYLGMKSRRVTVTPELFDANLPPSKTKASRVKPILSNAYNRQLKTTGDSLFGIADLSKSNLTYRANKFYPNYNRIKNLNRKGNLIDINLYNDDIRYEIEVEQVSSIQYVPDQNLPRLQSDYAQGRSSGGTRNWFGPETGEFLSYGPLIGSLEYDGNDYPYDTNGGLVLAGNGNGIPANSYGDKVFESGVNSTSAASISAYSGDHTLSMSLTRTDTKNIFNRSGIREDRLEAKYSRNGRFLNLDGKFGARHNRIENANINALHNQIVFSDYLTPPSFSNNQGISISDGSQRSFSPGSFNNPQALLANNGSRLLENDHFAGVNGRFYLFEDLSINTGITLTRQDQEFQFSAAAGTSGFLNAYEGLKLIEARNWKAFLNSDYDDIYLGGSFYIRPSTAIEYSKSSLDYQLVENTGGTPFNTLNANPEKDVLQLKNSLHLELYEEVELRLLIQNNSFSSTLQGSQWFLPSAKLYLDLHNYVLGSSDFLESISFSTGYSRDVVDFPLFYNNTSHNSLQIALSESQGYTANNDLFASSSLSFEKVEQLELELKVALFNRLISLGASYLNATHQNSIFPVFTDQGWELQNQAEIRNRGFEGFLDLNIGYRSQDFSLTSRFTYSSNRPVVTRLNDPQEGGLPIAGFQEISKTLIKGQPAGILYGSAFERNTQGQLIIGADGFPMVANAPRILGNTIPDFNLGWSASLRFEKLSLNFVWDYQKGGDLWNGTQNVLNFFGRSEESARLRNTTNFIFPGVLADGTPNSQPVAFASPVADTNTNRWVRYGFGGVAEEAISDGSYLNLKSLSLTYNLCENEPDAFFKTVRFTLFANNLWNWTATPGHNPYSNLFGGASGSGMNFFNLPLASEIGFNINIKI